MLITRAKNDESPGIGVDACSAYDILPKKACVYAQKAFHNPEGKNCSIFNTPSKPVDVRNPGTMKFYINHEVLDLASPLCRAFTIKEGMGPVTRFLQNIQQIPRPYINLALTQPPGGGYVIFHARNATNFNRFFVFFY